MSLPLPACRERVCPISLSQPPELNLPPPSFMMGKPPVLPDKANIPLTPFGPHFFPCLQSQHVAEPVGGLGGVAQAVRQVPQTLSVCECSPHGPRGTARGLMLWVPCSFGWLPQPAANGVLC